MGVAGIDVNNTLGPKQSPMEKEGKYGNSKNALGMKASRSISTTSWLGAKMHLEEEKQKGAKFAYC